MQTRKLSNLVFTDKMHSYIAIILFIGMFIGISGCSSTPSKEATGKPSSVTTPVETKPEQTKAVEPSACLCPPPPEVKEPTVEPPKGKLVSSNWQALPDWGSTSLSGSWTAFLQTCSAPSLEPTLQAVCSEAQSISPNDDAQIKTFFETRFTPFQVVNGDESTSGMITGYYEPLLHGSRTQSEEFRYPLYAEPSDLLTIDLSSVYPELKNKRLRGRLEGTKVVPYYDRSEIEQPAMQTSLRDKVLVWVNDPVEVAFLHIQGSGQIKLDTGETMRVGYANQNGRPFRSVGRYLIQQGILTPAQTTLPGIRAWAKKHPKQIDRLLNFNPSYVFFRELPLNLPGPIGTLGVPLTAEHSVAIDRRTIPLGVPVYLSTTWPNSSRPLKRLMMAQDTGGAINGAVRADFFWGFGDDAGKLAGVMKQRGEMWVLLPNNYPVPQ